MYFTLLFDSIAVYFNKSEERIVLRVIDRVTYVPGSLLYFATV